MGNLISSSASPVNPLSGAGTIIGIISFIFTVATAIRVFWSNLLTIGSAQEDVSTILPGLKQSLIEEKQHLKTVRRKCNSQYCEGAFHVLYIAVRQMLQEFKHIEAPFRDEEPDSSYRDNNHSYGNGSGNGGAYQHKGRRRRGSSRRGEKERRLENGGGDETEDDYYMTTYSARSLRRRWIWLHRRSAVLNMTERLSRIQTRRIARQTTDIAVDVRYIASAITEMQDRMDELEQRNTRNGRRMMD